MKPIDKLTEEVIGLAMKVHRTLGPGFLESVYQKALAMELTRAGCRVDSEKPLRVIYKGAVVGDFAATGIDDALLINFGASSLQFKRKRRLPKPPSG
ncbi:MAG TPA: GxxExxY protein [Lacunisphaera sp.]|nr:GxxExxY protein [Lacunisphaera sp.]